MNIKSTLKGPTMGAANGRHVCSTATCGYRTLSGGQSNNRTRVRALRGSRFERCSPTSPFAREIDRPSQPVPTRFAAFGQWPPVLRQLLAFVVDRASAEPLVEFIERSLELVPKRFTYVRVKSSEPVPGSQIGCSGRRGGQADQPDARTSSSSAGPHGRHKVIVLGSVITW